MVLLRIETCSWRQEGGYGQKGNFTKDGKKKKKKVREPEAELFVFREEKSNPLIIWKMQRTNEHGDGPVYKS